MRRLGIFVLVYAVLLPFVSLQLMSQIVVRIKSGDLYKGWFTEPVEVLYVVFWNGLKVRITNYLDRGIYLDLDRVVKESGFQYSDIMFVIHNHWFYPYPSDADKTTFRRMRENGFKGWFLIYRQATEEILEIGIKEKQ
jgi:hypothetical protein